MLSAAIVLPVGDFTENYVVPFQTQSTPGDLATPVTRTIVRTNGVFAIQPGTYLITM